MNYDLSRLAHQGPSLCLRDARVSSGVPFISCTVSLGVSWLLLRLQGKGVFTLTIRNASQFSTVPFAKVTSI